MAKFNSKWKIEEDKLSDVAGLAYPHTVTNTNDETVATIATVEEAEALLDWYKDNYEHGMITQKLIKKSSARRKLRGAAERRHYLQEKAGNQERRLAEFEAAENKRAMDKEARRSLRLAVRDDAAIALYLPQKEHDLRTAIARVADLARELSTIPMVMDHAHVEQIGRTAAALTSAVGAVRQHQFGAATSRLFAIHCAKSAATKTNRTRHEPK